MILKSKEELWIVIIKFTCLKIPEFRKYKFWKLQEYRGPLGSLNIEFNYFDNENEIFKLMKKYKIQ